MVHHLGMSRSLTFISQMMQSQMMIFVETLDILLGALEVLSEESEPLGLRVSWVKTKIQAFNDILDAAIFSVPICGEDVEVMERLTYLGSDIHVPAVCEPRSIDVCVGPGESWIHSIMGCGAVGTYAGGQVIGPSSRALWM